MSSGDDNYVMHMHCLTSITKCCLHANWISLVVSLFVCAGVKNKYRHPMVSMSENRTGQQFPFKFCALIRNVILTNDDVLVHTVCVFFKHYRKFQNHSRCHPHNQQNKIPLGHTEKANPQSIVYKVAPWDRLTV